MMVIAMHDPVTAEVAKFPKAPEAFDRSYACITVQDASGARIDLYLSHPEIAYALMTAASRAEGFLRQEIERRAEALLGQGA